MKPTGILKRERLGVDSHGARAAISILFKQIEVTTRREREREEKKAGRIKMAIGVRRGGRKYEKKRSRNSHFNFLAGVWRYFSR